MRLPPLGELSERQAEISDQITSRRGGTRGPFLVWLRSPGLCERVEALGAYCRFESELPERLRELSLLIAARFWDAQYSWNAHVDKAIQHGIEPAAVTAIAEQRPPKFGRHEDQVFYEFCMEILTDHFVSDQLFAQALSIFGEAGLVDTIGCLGNFSMLSMCLNTFQVDLQKDREPPFPDVRGYAKVDSELPGTTRSAPEGHGRPSGALVPDRPV